MPAEPSKQAEEDAARIATAEAAICAIERHTHALAENRGDADRYAAAGGRVMDFYRERIEGLSEDESDAARAQELLFRDFRLVGVKAERIALAELIRERRVGSETIRKLTRELDLAEARHRG